MSATVFTIGHYNDAGTLDRKFYLPFAKLDATAAPGAGNDDSQGYVAGSIWADRTNNKVYLCTDNGTGAATWVEAGGGSGTVTSVALSNPGAAFITVGGSPVTTSGTITQTWTGTTGDLLYCSATDTWSKLAAGTNGHVLKLAGGVPTWAAASGTGDVVGPASSTDRGIAVFDGTTGKLLETTSVTIDVSNNILGVTTINKVVITQPATGSTLQIADGKAFVCSNTITLAGTDGNTLNIGDGATLSALAGTAWAANTLAIGSGAGTVAQVSFAANKFPARASTGNLVAKDITDFALTILDDADAAAVRTTIGAGTGSGDALVANPLSQFAATTSAQLAGVISDETGSGKVVFDTAPTLSSNVTIGTAGGTTGAALLKGTTSGTVTLSVADAAGTHTIKLPTADGSANQVLKTDGSGQWGWTTAGGSGTVTEVSCSDGSISVATGTTTPVLSLVQSRLGMQGGTTNLGFSYSASAGAGTVSLTDAAGSTPSSSTPVSVTFQDGDGSVTTLTRTSTLTLTIPSGASLANEHSYRRVWVVVFNDAGTLRLGVITCRVDVTNIYPLSEGVAASSTAMSTGSDSGGVFYTDSAVTSKYYRVLGYFEIDTLTAGTWVAADRVILWTPGMHLPGDVIQTVYAENNTYTTSTGTIPIDNTIPQSSEGSEYFNQSITPTSKQNIIAVSTFLWAYCSVTATAIVFAFFKDSDANAWFANDVVVDTANYRRQIYTEQRRVSQTTSSTAFKLRMGGSGASTVGIGGFAGSQYYGGVATSWFKIVEIMA